MPVVDKDVMRWYGMTTASPALLMEPQTVQYAVNHALTGGAATGQSATNAPLTVAKLASTTVTAQSPLRQTLVAQGTLPNGSGYVDVRFDGTATTDGEAWVEFALDPRAIDATQRVGLQLDVTVVDGDLNGTGSVTLRQIVGKSDNTLSYGAVSRNFRDDLIALDEKLARLAFVAASGVSNTNKLTALRLRLSLTRNIPLDVTLRLSRPQAEMLTMTSFVSNTSAAQVTRAADDWNLAPMLNTILLPSNVWTVMLAVNVAQNAQGAVGIPLLTASDAGDVGGGYFQLYADAQNGLVGLRGRAQANAELKSVEAKLSPLRSWVTLIASADGEFIYFYANGRLYGSIPQPSVALTFARLNSNATRNTALQSVLLCPGAADLGLPLLMPRNMGEAEAMRLHLRWANELLRVPLPELWSLLN